MKEHHESPEGTQARAPGNRASPRELQRTAYELTENIPVGTYTMVLRPGETLAHFSFISTRFLELTGLTRERARADPLEALRCVHPEDYDRWIKINAEAFANRAPFYGETRVVPREGEIRWVSAESIPCELADGTIVWEGVLIDITRQKMAEAEIQKTHQALLAAEIERSRLDERRQLLEDIHDGVGAQLAIASIEVRHGKLSQDEVGAILQSCIDDLHLVVDTLQGAGDSLVDAVAAFRHRLEPRLSRLPVRVRWRLELDDKVHMESKRILQSLRILQEAVANALKHAQASQIEIAAISKDRGSVCFMVRDDGVGFDTQRDSGGQGLENMRRRATSMGARLRIEPSHPGTEIRLELP